MLAPVPLPVMLTLSFHLTLLRFSPPVSAFYIPDSLKDLLGMTKVKCQPESVYIFILIQKQTDVNKPLDSQHQQHTAEPRERRDVTAAPEAGVLIIILLLTRFHEKHVHILHF